LKVRNHLRAASPFVVDREPFETHLELLGPFLEVDRCQVVQIRERHWGAKEVPENLQHVAAGIQPIGTGDDQRATRREHALEPPNGAKRGIHVFERAD
jgi:hypothetical protein